MTNLVSADILWALHKTQKNDELISLFSNLEQALPAHEELADAPVITNIVHKAITHKEESVRAAAQGVLAALYKSDKEKAHMILCAVGRSSSISQSAAQRIVTNVLECQHDMEDRGMIAIFMRQAKKGRAYAKEMLCAIAKNVPALRDIVRNAFLDAASSEDMGLSIVIRDGISNIIRDSENPGSAAVALAHIGKVHKNSQTRAVVQWALANYINDAIANRTECSPALDDAIIDVARYDPCVEVRVAALENIKKLAVWPDHLRAPCKTELLKIADEAPDPVSRRLALEGYARSIAQNHVGVRKRDAIRRIIRCALYDQAEGVCKAALGALEAFLKHAGLTVTKNDAVLDTRPALQKIALDFLFAAKGDKDPAMRVRKQEAIQAIFPARREGYPFDENLTARLIETATTDPVPDVRAAARGALGNLFYNVKDLGSLTFAMDRAMAYAKRAQRNPLDPAYAGAHELVGMLVDLNPGLTVKIRQTKPTSRIIATLDACKL